MKNSMHQYNDFAIPIAWPDQTARGDESWMKFFKSIGIVKNLNFKVGHAAIVLVERKTGLLRYFDFGRYICPRGYGRARSSLFDPRLEISTRAVFSAKNEILNLSEILAELKQMESATHGGGRLLCSLCDNISFTKAQAYAEELVDKGPVLYGALAQKNNSCSRYVAQILVEGMEKDDYRINKIYYPLSIKASPTSNVVNATRNGEVFCYSDNVLQKWSMNRWQSLKFQLSLLKPNFFSSAAAELPSDLVLGFIEEPMRPVHLPAHAQWLGGLGEGCWFSLISDGLNIQITRYSYKGDVDYTVVSELDDQFNAEESFKFSYHIHHQKHIIDQLDRRIVFSSLDHRNIKQTINI